MKKRSILKWICTLPVLLLAMAGCSQEDSEFAGLPADPDMIGAAGGIVTGLNGDVVLTIPEGAVTEPVKFEIQFVPRGGGSLAMLESEFIDPFVIEPFVTFKKPVQINVKCQGCLSKGNVISDGMSVFISVWGSQADYKSQAGSCTICCCCSNSISQCFKAEIGTTGTISTGASLLGD